VATANDDPPGGVFQKEQIHRQLLFSEILKSPEPAPAQPDGEAKAVPRSGAI
jgi:hypothetical protein